MTLSPETLHRLLSYDALTGTLFWRERPVEMFTTGSSHIPASWNTKWSGKPALNTIGKHGYRHGTIFAKDFRAHRVIWAMVTGSWPECEVDHANLNRADNAWSNLRAATKSQNQFNRGRSRNNTSGAKGVSFIAKIGKWQATIGVNGKNKNLGYFDDRANAADAYAKASNQLHAEYGRTSCV